MLPPTHQVGCVGWAGGRGGMELGRVGMGRGGGGVAAMSLACRVRLPNTAVQHCPPTLLSSPALQHC